MLAIGDSIAERPGNDSAPFAVGLRRFQKGAQRVRWGRNEKFEPAEAAAADARHLRLVRLPANRHSYWTMR